MVNREWRSYFIWCYAEIWLQGHSKEKRTKRLFYARVIHKCIYGSSPVYLGNLRVADPPLTSTSLRIQQPPSLLHHPLGLRKIHSVFSICDPQLWNSRSMACRREPWDPKLKDLKSELYDFLLLVIPLSVLSTVHTLITFADRPILCIHVNP